ncbi:MAG: DUF6438 domain-containing protein [Bacteroidia bacterium]|nr:DUF6438 domain-containing protein [Bacteroidia bacterium]MDW8158151.1 DUF6438 domain-containing protein [Bacteroidia bacterium]
MKKIITYFSTAVGLLLIIVSCTTSRSSKGKEENKPWLTIEKTSCYGSCPQYHLAIYPNRVVIYKGRRFVKNIGTFEKKLSKAKISQIQQQIIDYAFFEFEEVYDNEGISDLPSVILYCRLNGKEKKVKARMNVPPTFLQLVNRIENLIGEEGYKPLFTATKNAQE